MSSSTEDLLAEFIDEDRRQEYMQALIDDAASGFPRAEVERLFASSDSDLRQRVVVLVECLGEKLDLVRRDRDRLSAECSELRDLVPEERDGTAKRKRNTYKQKSDGLAREKRRHDAVKDRMAKGMNKMQAAKAVAEEEGRVDSRVVLDAHTKQSKLCPDCSEQADYVLICDEGLLGRCPDCDLLYELPRKLLGNIVGGEKWTSLTSELTTVRKKLRSIDEGQVEGDADEVDRLRRQERRLDKRLRSMVLVEEEAQEDQL